MLLLALLKIQLLLSLLIGIMDIPALLVFKTAVAIHPVGTVSILFQLDYFSMIKLALCSPRTVQSRQPLRQQPVPYSNYKDRIQKYFRKMSPKMFKCTRCTKDYVYKGGLSAHIKKEHPLGVQPERVKQTKKPVGPEATPTINVGIVPNLNTQEVDNLLAEEEEFYDAIDELEHGIGINKSMLEWANINFNSSFGDSGEFEGRVSVEKLVNCVDCETNSKTINMQAELLTKLDKQLQDCHNKLKASKKHEKQMEIKLSDAMKIIQKHESVTMICPNFLIRKILKMQFLPA